MIRNQVLSTDQRYRYQHSPRKSRTYNASGVFQPSLLYKPKYWTAPEFDPRYRWVGKKFIPWDGGSLDPLLYRSLTNIANIGKLSSNYVSEYEIANYAKSHIYRIVYVVIDKNGKLKFRSKPSVDLVPGRLNVLLTPDNIIRDIGYF